MNIDWKKGITLVIAVVVGIIVHDQLQSRGLLGGDSYESDDFESSDYDPA